MPEEEFLQNEFESASDSAELTVTEEQLENVDLVSLIDQPAWKVILLELIKREKMDVWNIDVSILAQKYLEKIQQMQSISLRVPANAILVCAILVKTKSKFLRFPSLEEPEEKITEQQRLELEGMLPELTTTAKLREDVVTLNDLVSSIEEILAKAKFSEKPALIPRREVLFNLNFSEEDIDKKIEKLRLKLLERADSEGLVLFSDLIDEPSILEMVNTFIPLLFLMNKGRILMWQESFWGEIFVSILQKMELESPFQTEDMESES